MDSDFPAAHSMDTTWFAVDKDGHVACFHSHEAGAVPETASMGDQAYDITMGLGTTLRPGEAIHELGGRLVPGPLRKEGQHMFSGSLPLLMFLRSLDPIREDIAAGRATPMASSEGTAVQFDNVPDDLFRRLHDEGVCLACFYEATQAYAQAGLTSVDVATLGVFRYEHLTENWISGPYGLVRRPSQPITIDQLPQHFRELVAQMRFERLCFSETLHIQPVEHTPCASWETAWIDSAGQRIQPIPGREGEYAEHYGEMADDMPAGLDAEPPSP